MNLLVVLMAFTLLGTARGSSSSLRADCVLKLAKSALKSDPIITINFGKGK